MKLLTKEIERKLRANYKNENQSDLKPVVKMFGGGESTWLFTSIDENDNLFGLCFIGRNVGDPECGFVNLEELKSIRFPPFGLPVERDMYWSPDKTLGEYAKESIERGYLSA